MARIRSIKPEFWTDEKIIELSPTARLLFIGLWNFADDEGRMVLSPKRIRLQILPADNCDISELLGEIRRELLITLYTVDGIEYLQVNGFRKHQKIDKRSASKLPSPAESPRIPTTDQGRDQGREGIKDQGMDQGGDQGKDQNHSGASASSSARDPSKAAPLPIEEESQSNGTPAGAMAAELRRRGVSVTSQHPTLLQWLKDGRTIPEMVEHVAIARERKPLPEQIPANYLDAIVRNPPKASQGPGWWTSDELIQAKATEMGLSANRGEEMQQFKQRIFDAIAAKKRAA